MPWGEAAWQGVFHAISAFNNAGFSTWGDSVMRFSSDALVLVPLMLAIIIGGLGFPVLHELLAERRRKRPLWSMHTAIIVWGLAGADRAGHGGDLSGRVPATRAPWDYGLGTQGAGFAVHLGVGAHGRVHVLDIGALSTESLALHYILMFIGRGSAGTAGGVKVTTFFVLVLVVWNEIRGHRDVELGGRRIADSVQRQAITILVLSSAVVGLAMLLILPLTPLPLEEALFLKWFPHLALSACSTDYHG
ncbi:potassium transporter TrkG [Acidovorax sp.]|uniref:potassium transporter TrkG n=1 Tax=Acidovorax sp. TaxID=1872122 RepID=UPI002ACE28FF|nr:potassium transporter TrkG [Acidovorax sp.]MDZ7865373.1 potassium transporter TrkG [Acidovorax sp.]